MSLLLLNGCSYFLKYREVRLFLPEIPPSWRHRFPTLRYELTYPDYSTAGALSTQILEAGVNTVILPVPKAAFVPCLLQPLTESGSLKPAGAVITGENGLYKGGECVCRWEDGFLSDLLLRLFEREDLYPALNVERLRLEILAKGEGNVWDLDPDPVLLGLSFGSFSSNKLRLLPEKEIDVPLSPGTWIWDNPFRLPLEIAEDTPETLKLPMGKHYLFHLQSDECVSVYIGEKEWYLVFLLKGAYISGNW